MKKSISVLFCLVLLLSMMTACGNSAENDVRPGDGDNKPGVHDNVDTGNDGILDDQKNNPKITDHPVTDAVENGVNDATNAARRGMDSVDKAAKDIADDMKNK